MRYFTGYSILFLIVLPLVVSAKGSGMADFVPLIGIPGLHSGDYTIERYINILYVLAISVAAFLAVVRLMLAGLQYILTDVVPQKQNAKDAIRSSLAGLLIVLSAVLILYTINPQLTTLDALSGVNQLHSPKQRAETVSAPNDVTIGNSSGKDIQNLLNNCTNGEVVAVSTNEYCCSTAPSCNPSGETNEFNIDTSIVYTNKDYLELISTDGFRKKALDIGFSDFTDAVNREGCKLAAGRRGRSLSEVVDVKVNVPQQGMQRIQTRTICVFE